MYRPHENPPHLPLHPRAGQQKRRSLLFDDRIYLVNLDGKAATLAAGPKPEVLWRTDFHERIAATPALADDTLYVRTETKLFAFKERR